MGSEYSELREASGVDTVPELANRKAANLTQAMAKVNQEMKLTRQVPTEAVVSKWIEQAKTLPRMINTEPNDRAEARAIKNGARRLRFLWVRKAAYLPLPAIMSWMIGARISSIAKPILAPGTTMVLRRDMKEFWIMFKR